MEGKRPTPTPTPVTRHRRRPQGRDGVRHGHVQRPRQAPGDVPSVRSPQSRRSVRRRVDGAAFTAGSGLVAPSAGESLRMSVGAGETGQGSDVSDTKTPIPKIAALVKDHKRLGTWRHQDDTAMSDGGRVSSGSAALGEVGEQLVMMFLPFVPDRLRVEAVCRRWRDVSQRDVPVDTLNLDSAKVPRQQDLLRLLGRADGMLKQLVLPDVRIGDAHVQIIQRQSKLRALRAYRLQKKHLFAILESCTKLETLELLDCAELQLSGWKREFAPALREIWLRRCFFLTSIAVKVVLQAGGATLKKLYLTGASNADSQVLRLLARYADELEELAMTHCRGINRTDLEAFVDARASTLRWLDLSSCPGVSFFPPLSVLPMLQVLMLDKTSISDEGLRAVASSASNLKYLSLQDCRSITDAGIVAIASGCIHLELLDLKGTRVADVSLQALESACPHLQMVRLDSCRSVSRETRQKYDNMARDRTLRGRLDELEQHFMARQRVEVIREASSSSESSSEGSDDEYVASP